MAEQTKEATGNLRESSRKRQVSPARVDAPHIVPKKNAETAPDPTAAEGIAVDPGDAVGSVEPIDVQPFDSLDVHAQQLARQLQEQQQRLDRREAHLNAMHADLDSRHRIARLWLSERETFLAEKATALEAKEHEVAQCGSQIATAKATSEKLAQTEREKLDQRANELRRREAAAEETERRFLQRENRLKAAQAELEERRRRHEDQQRWDQQRYMARRAAFLELVRLQNAGIERRRLALESEAARPAQGHHSASEICHLSAREISARQQQLEEAETTLRIERQELSEIRQKQTAKHEALIARAEELREKLDARRRQAAARIARETELLNRRQKEVAGQKRALEETRQEVVRIHRETLELRLAVEEIWTQLSTAVAPAVMTESLGKTRRKLADHYRLAREEIATRQKELEAAREGLSRDHQELIAQKHDLEDWLARRHSEHDEREAALAARQRALETRENEQTEQWSEGYDRHLSLEQEVRRKRAEKSRSVELAT